MLDVKQQVAPPQVKDDTVSSNNDSAGTSRDIGKVLGIDHLAIAVESVEQALPFFVECLGFELVERRTTRGDHTSMCSAVLRSGQAIVVLVQGLEEDSQVTRFIRRYGPGIQHIGLSVSNLGSVLARLKSHGVIADTDTVRGDGISQVFLKRDEPSSLRVELIERQGGDFTDDTVERIFREFESRHIY